LDKKLESSEVAEEVEDLSKSFELRRLFARNDEMIVISIISKTKFSSRPTIDPFDSKGSGGKD
jgi:hypothetical protein